MNSQAYLVWCGVAMEYWVLCWVFCSQEFKKVKMVNNMKKFKIRPANKKLIIILVILIFLEVTAFRCYFGTLNPYIKELNIVYTPTKPAYKFYHWYWIDIYDYYVFRLSNREEKIIVQEAEEGKWSELTPYHINELDYYEHYEEFLDYSYRHHKCFICIYDEQNNQIVTDSNNDMPPNRIIFLYDTETNKYYCVFETM